MATTSVPATRAQCRPALRLHRSTWVWLALALALLLLANLPGDLSQPVWAHRTIEHGWPWTYAIRDLEEWSTSALWQVTRDVATFEPLPLVGDVLVAGGLLAALAIWRERRLRRRSPDARPWWRKLPWRGLLSVLLVYSVAAIWIIEQMRLAAGDRAIWELRVSDWVYRHFGVNGVVEPLGMLLLAAVLFLALHCYDRYFPATSGSRRIMTRWGTIFTIAAAIYSWILWRIGTTYAAATALLVDALAAGMLLVLLTGIVRRWAAWRRSPPRRIRWQFSLQGLLGWTVASAMLVAVGVDAIWLVEAGRHLNGSLRPSAEMHFSGLRYLTNLGGKLGFWEPVDPWTDVELPLDADSQVWARFVIDRDPRGTTVRGYGPLTPDELVQLGDLRNAWSLILTGVDRELIPCARQFDDLRWLYVSRWHDDWAAHPQELLLPHLADKQRLRTLFLFGERAGDAQLEALAGLTELEEVQITWNPGGYADFFDGPWPDDFVVYPDRRKPYSPQGRITDQGLPHFSGLTRLRRMLLEGTEIKGPGLAYLHGLPRLHHLRIKQAPLDDAGLSYLNGCRNLRTLSLVDTEITTLAALRWNDLPRLKRVDVSGTRISHVELQQLRKNHPGIEITHRFFDQIGKPRWSPRNHLVVRDKVREFHLACLDGWTALRHINFSGSDITDDGLAHLGGCPLETVDLSRTAIGDAGLVHVARSHALEVLDLRNTDITSRGLEHLGGCTELRRLWLGDTAVDDTGMRHVSGRMLLESLSLENTHVTSTGLQHLTGLPMLSHLTLDCSMIDPAAIRMLKTLPSLASIDLRHPDGDEAAVKTATALRAKLPPNVFVWP
jgi:hypothetical protein